MWTVEQETHKHTNCQLNTRWQITTLSNGQFNIYYTPYIFYEIYIRLILIQVVDFFGGIQIINHVSMFFLMERLSLNYVKKKYIERFCILELNISLSFSNMQEKFVWYFELNRPSPTIEKSYLVLDFWTYSANLKG